MGIIGTILLVFIAVIVIQAFDIKANKRTPKDKNIEDKKKKSKDSSN